MKTWKHEKKVSLLVGGAAFLAMALIGYQGIAAQQSVPAENMIEPSGTAAYMSDPVWAKAKREVDKSVVKTLSDSQGYLKRTVPKHKLRRGDTAVKEVALTFDDGPHPKYTPQLLNILARYRVKATFFLVGEMARKYPGLVRAEIAAGHSVGNHTYHHVNLTKVPTEDVAVEIRACSDVIKDITGKAPILFRPPGGDYDTGVSEVADAMGYTTILWTDDPGDYASPGDKVIETRLLDRISNGGIILIHDGIQQTIDVLPQIIQHLESHAYKFVTIDEMLVHKQRSALDTNRRRAG